MASAWWRWSAVDDVIVVETDDAVLVGKADRMQEVKTVVSQLKTKAAVKRPGTARSIVRGAPTIRSTTVPASR